MSCCDMNSRQSIFVRLSAFRFFVIAMYVACLINLLTSINIASLVFSVYESFAEGILMIKFIVTMWNDFTFSENIAIKLL